jgi:hypothetical protein
MAKGGGFHSHGLAIAFPPREACKSNIRQMVAKTVLNLEEKDRQTKPIGYIQ